MAIVIAMAHLRAWVKQIHWHEGSAARQIPWRAEGVAMTS
jgi:hypothetical protein